FPDPFELGTLEEKTVKAHFDKLAPAYKASSGLKKVQQRVSEYFRETEKFLHDLSASADRSSDLRDSVCAAVVAFAGSCDVRGMMREQSDVTMSLQPADKVGGGLQPEGNEEALLAAQGHACRGCGCAIGSDFLGMRKDYHPCRHAGALFCRRRCHSDAHR
ncbi:unnamed protein product, partial [Phaeothamnion confervicola]